MFKLLVSTAALLTGASMMLGSAQAGPMSSNVEEAKKQSQVTLDWLAGTLDNYGTNKVTYDGPAFTLRSSSHVPGVSGLAKLQTAGWKNLERMSNGKIKVELTWSQTVHSASEGRTAVRTGLSDHAPCFSLYHARDYDMMNGLGLPFLYTNSHEATATAEHLYPKYLKKEFERYQVLLMRGAHTGPYQLFTNKPVRTLEELKGLKVRGGGGTHSKILEALGAIPTNMPAPDTYPAMQNGTIDGIHFNDAAALTFRLNEVSKFRTINDLNMLTVEYCLSPDFFYGLPTDLQVVVNNWGRQMAIAEAVGFYDYDGVVNVVEMNKQTGLETITMTDAEMARWRDALKGVEAEWVETIAKKGLPAAEFIADVKKTSARFQKMTPNDVMLDAINNPVQGIYDIK